jgi:hypothetical protein
MASATKVEKTHAFDFSLKKEVKGQTKFLPKEMNAQQIAKALLKRQGKDEAIRVAEGCLNTDSNKYWSQVVQILKKA